MGVENLQAFNQGGPMVTVTDAAGAHMAQLLAQAESDRDVVIRLVLDERDIVPTMDQPRVGDTAFSYKGKTVLVLDTLVVQAMADHTLDVQEADDGCKIILR